MEVLQTNAYFAHPEILVLGMLCDKDENVRRIAVNKIQCINRNNHHQSQFMEHEDCEASSSQSNNNSTTAVRKFILPELNVKAKAYHQLVNLDSMDFEQPPAVQYLDDATIEQCRSHPLILKHPCHNQRVERHVKLVTEASVSVAGHDNRDGMICQRIRSRKLMKQFETKKQFNV